MIQSKGIARSHVLSVTFCLALCGNNAYAQGLFEALGGALSQVGAAAVTQSAAGSAQDAAQAKAVAAAVPCPPQKNGQPSPLCSLKTLAVPAASRPTPELDRLFTGSEISGSQLLSELKTIRGAVGSRQLNNAMNTLIGGNLLANPAALTSSSGLFSSLLSGATDTLLDLLVSHLSYKALDLYFANMSDNPNLLDDIKINMPKADGLTPEAKQQVATLAGFLVAIKGSGKIIDASQNDFETAKNSYRKVMEQREQAARLLGNLLFQRSGLAATEKEEAARKSLVLTPEQREYLDYFRDRKPEDLLHDFQAQNLALQFMQKSDPEFMKGYQAEMQTLTTHYTAYARAATGATSMLAFSSLFLKRTKNLLEKSPQQPATIAPVLSMAGDGLTEVLSLGKRATTLLTNSDDFTDGSFALVKNRERMAGLSAAKLIDKLDDTGRGVLTEGLVRNGTSGYLYQLYTRRPETVGNIADDATSKNDRAAFAKAYYELEDAPDFTFVNALEKAPDGAGKRNLAKDLLVQLAKADAVADDEKALAKVQQAIADNTKKWDNTTLRQVVLANNQGNAAAPALRLGDAEVIIDVPGMSGLVDYEQMVMGAMKHATVAVPAAKPAAKAAPEDKAPAAPAKGKKRK